jgi:histidyl-tRNA synthetase
LDGIQGYLRVLFKEYGYKPLFIPSFLSKKIFSKKRVGPEIWKKQIEVELNSGKVFLRYEGTIPSVWISERERRKNKVSVDSWYPQKVWYSIKIFRDENPKELKERGKYIDAFQTGIEYLLGQENERTIRMLPEVNAEIIYLGQKATDNFTPTIARIWPLGAIQEIMRKYEQDQEKRNTIAVGLDACDLDFTEFRKKCKDEYRIKVNEKLLKALEQMYSVSGDTENILSGLRELPSEVIRRLDLTVEELQNYGLRKDLDFRVIPIGRSCAMYAKDLVFEFEPYNGKTGEVAGGGVYLIDGILGTGFGIGDSRLLDASK